MADKRYRVFLSSTYRDLRDVRQEVARVLLEMNCIPAGMEQFPAFDEEQWQYIKKEMDDSDYYVLIVGGRYGSTTPDGISYTEKEFDYAVARKLHILAFLHESPESLPVERYDMSPAAQESLQSFRNKVARGRLFRTWRTPADLPRLVATSLHQVIEQRPALGWVRPTASLLENAVIDSREARARSIISELGRLAQSPNLAGKTVRLSGFLSAFAIGPSDPYPEALRAHHGLVLKEKEQLLRIARSGCKIKCIISPVNESNYRPEGADFALRRTQRLLGWLNSSDEALRHIEWSVSRLAARNLYIVDRQSCFEGYKGAGHGFEFTLRQDSSEAVNAVISMYDAYFSELEAQTLARWGRSENGGSSRLELLRMAACHSLESSLAFLSSANDLSGDQGASVAGKEAFRELDAACVSGSLPERQYALARRHPGEYVVLAGEKVIYHSDDRRAAGRAFKQAFADCQTPAMVHHDRCGRRREGIVVRGRALNRRR